MTGLMLLVLWCGIGGAVGVALGNARGRALSGLFLGVFLNLFGWVMIFGAPERQPSRAPALSPLD